MQNKLFFAIVAAAAIFSTENVFCSDIGGMQIWGRGGLRERISMYNNFVTVGDFESANKQIDDILNIWSEETINNSTPLREFLFGKDRFLAGGNITNYKKLLEAKKKTLPKDNSVKLAQDELLKIKEYSKASTQILNNIQASTDKDAANVLLLEFKKLDENIKKSMDLLGFLHLGATGQNKNAVQEVINELNKVEQQLIQDRQAAQVFIDKLQPKVDLMTPANNEFGKIQTYASAASKILDEIKKSGNKTAAMAILPRFDGVQTNIRNSINAIEGLLKRSPISVTDSQSINALLTQSRGIEAQVTKQRGEAQDFIDKMPTTGDGQGPANNLVKQAIDELAKIQGFANTASQALTDIRATTDKNVGTTLLKGIEDALVSITTSIIQITGLTIDPTATGPIIAQINKLVKQAEEIQSQVTTSQNTADDLVKKMSVTATPLGLIQRIDIEKGRITAATKVIASAVTDAKNAKSQLIGNSMIERINNYSEQINDAIVELQKLVNEAKSAEDSDRVNNALTAGRDAATIAASSLKEAQAYVAKLAGGKVPPPVVNPLNTPAQRQNAVKQLISDLDAITARNIAGLDKPLKTIKGNLNLLAKSADPQRGKIVAIMDLLKRINDYIAAPNPNVLLSINSAANKLSQADDED